MTHHTLQGRTESEVLWFRRRSFLQGAAAFTALGGFGAAQAQQRSNIVELQGDALLNGSQLRRDQLVQTGDRIETGPGSNMVFVIDLEAALGHVLVVGAVGLEAALFEGGPSPAGALLALRGQLRISAEAGTQQRGAAGHGIAHHHPRHVGGGIHFERHAYHVAAAGAPGHGLLHGRHGLAHGIAGGKGRLQVDGGHRLQRHPWLAGAGVGHLQRLLAAFLGPG